MHSFSTLLASSLALIATADVRFSSKVGSNPSFECIQPNVQENTDALGNPIEADTCVAPYQVPSTFNYDALQQQKENNNDNFLRSNIDNQANQRNTATEAAQDMLPCRRSDAIPQVQVTYQRGETAVFPIRWNNPHDADCEFNLWTGDRLTVYPLRRPFPCGAGYQNERFELTIPLDTPGCATAADGCVLQFYAHSVETRTYAICTDVIITDGPVPIATNPTAIPVTATPALAAGNATNALTLINPPVAAADTQALLRYGQQTRHLQDAATNGLLGSLPSAVPQAAILYCDSYDTSHLDSNNSLYRGQQGAFIRDELAAAIELHSYINNGGLVPLNDPLQDARDELNAEVKQAIKDAEEVAIEANKAAQDALDAEGNGECFEGELYGNVNNPNCNRQYTNTYVTNVGYRAIMNDFQAKFDDAGITPYSVTLKDTPFQTCIDNEGQYQVDGQPSTEPARR